MGYTNTSIQANQYVDIWLRKFSKQISHLWVTDAWDAIVMTIVAIGLRIYIGKDGAL